MAQSPTFYDFAESFGRGKRGEDILDTYFADRFDIRPVSMDQDRLGIDRIFTNHLGRQLTVQYKTDRTAATTGNVFIETVSVDYPPKAGWVFSCSADWLIYYVPGWDMAYVVRPAALKAKVREWYGAHQCRAIPNKSYHTIGVLVPRHIFATVAEREIDLRGVV
jgi:hypothetical protein